MNIYTISYDLRQPERNYQKLYNAMKSFPAYCPVLDSLWFIGSNDDLSYVYNKLYPIIDKDDRLLINVLTPYAQGYLDNKVIEWLKKVNWC